MQAKSFVNKCVVLVLLGSSGLVQNEAMAFSCLQTVVKSGSMVVTSPFGWRFSANPNGKGKWQFHYGTDFSKKILPNPMVVAPIEGKYYSFPGTSGCGNMAIISQSDGFSVKFCHLRNFEPDAAGKPRVNGSTVNIGDQIGIPSNTGILPNPEHIHLEVITKGNATQTTSMRVPPPFCGGVSYTFSASVGPSQMPPANLVRPAGVVEANVYGTPGTNFDKAFYDAYMAQNAISGTTPSSSIAVSDVKPVTTTGKLTDSGSKASNQPPLPAPVTAEEMSFSEMIVSEAKKRFGSELWYSDLAQKNELPLYYELSVMTAYQIYMQYQKHEIAENIVQLSATRTALLNEVAAGIKQKKLRDAGLRSIAP